MVQSIDHIKIKLFAPLMDTERCLADPLLRSLLFKKEFTPLGPAFSLFRKLVTFFPPEALTPHADEEELTKDFTVRDLTMLALVLTVVGRDRTSGAGVAAALPGVLPLLLLLMTLLKGFAAGLATSAIVLRRWLGLVMELEVGGALEADMADSIAIVMRTPTCLSC